MLAIVLALQYVCIVTIHVAHQSLNWRTPIEWLLGSTPDTSNTLVFIFYEPVYYALEDTKQGKPQEAVGRFVGLSENVGHTMTFKILTDNGKILHRSWVRTCNKEGAFKNKRALKEAIQIAPGPEVTTTIGSNNKELMTAKEKAQMRSREEETVVPETVEEEEEEPQNLEDITPEPIPSLGDNDG